MAQVPFPRESLIQRAKILELCERDLDYRNAVYTLCKKDLVFWVNNFCFTYDPRSDVSKDLPFVLFQRQEEYLRWREGIIKEKDHGIVEKSRDMGVSWLNVVHHVHQWLFNPGFKGTFGSRKKEYVDELNNIDSLLEKVRYVIRKLPPWMKPKEYRLNYLKIVNIDNFSSITGEIGSDTGRGGRSTFYDADEFAFLQNAEAADSGISQNTETAFYTSTPNGNDTLYYQKRFSGKIPVFTFNYYDHPGKDEEWLEEQKRKLDPLVVAREILIDYEGSSEGVVIPAEWVRSAVNLFLRGGGTKYAALDVADDGKDKNVYVKRHGVILNRIERWNKQTTYQTAHRANMLCNEDGVEFFLYDANGVGAGVTGNMKAMKEDNRLGYEVIGLKNSYKATENVYPKFDNKEGREIFKNLRAELYWNVRVRFEKTYEQVNGINFYDDDELISIPDDAKLIQTLSKPKFFFDSRGLIQIEDKKKMTISPDDADALAMLYAPAEMIMSPAWWM